MATLMDLEYPIFRQPPRWQDVDPPWRGFTLARSSSMWAVAAIYPWLVDDYRGLYYPLHIGDWNFGSYPFWLLNFPCLAGKHPSSMGEIPECVAGNRPHLCCSAGIFSLCFLGQSSTEDDIACVLKVPAVWGVKLVDGHHSRGLSVLRVPITYIYIYMYMYVRSHFGSSRPLCNKYAAFTCIKSKRGWLWIFGSRSSDGCAHSNATGG